MLKVLRGWFLEILFFLLVFGQSYAQTMIAKKEYMDADVNPGLVLDEFPLPPPEVKGSVYIDNEWRYGKILLKNGKEIGNIALKYDIQNNYIELKANEQIKICVLNVFNSFQWFNTALSDSLSFLNASTLTPKLREDKEFGVFQVLYNGGHIKLLKKTDIEIRDPNYNPALNFGSTDYKILKRDDFFLLQGSTYIPIDTSKKKIGLAFEENGQAIVKFIKANKLKPKDEQDLVQIVMKYQNILGQ